MTMKNGKWKMLRSLRRDATTGTLIFNVLVVPRASRSEIVGEHNGALRVRIAAPPVDGAANEELIRTLARASRFDNETSGSFQAISPNLKR
jgi:uncharacterized protein (TIGR00251 family)